MSSPDVSICVATCDRPQGLEQLLGSLDALEVPAGCRVELVVVDNAPEGDATARLRNRPRRHPMRWIEEPERNISLARNRALDAARGRWIAFVDDDESADPQWLMAYWKVSHDRPEAAWLGPVLPRLQRVVTPWLDAGTFYSRPRHTSGSPVPESEFRTGNAFLPRELFEHVRFDPAFGLSGGEDLDLFARMRNAGARFFWCDEAVVTEVVGPERHRLGWLTLRAFRGGVVHTRVSRCAGGRSSVAGALLRALVGLAAFSLALPVSALKGRAAAACIWLRLCTQAGHLWACAGRSYEQYAPSDPGSS